MSHSTKFAIHRWFLMLTTCICQQILKEELDDRADTIQWWLYEHVQKCIWYDLKNGRRMRYDMPTAESLYDYLTLPFEQLPLEVDTGDDNDTEAPDFL